jgi:hypothetical protein
VSNLHTEENMEWVRRLPVEFGARRGEEGAVDALITAGDVEA